MPRTKLSPEFKEAISDLSHKEKDKLLFRLLAKEPALVEQLTFQLLEDGISMEDRRNELKEHIHNHLHQYQRIYYSPGYLMMELRELSGQISRHVKATKDKYGEIQLNFLMLNLSLELFHQQIDTARPHKAKTLNEYVVKRALKLKDLLKKLHEDQHMDFWGDIEAFGENIGKIDSMVKTAKSLGLNINTWKN
ncbi:MAG: hypothetical protein KDD99_21085 [Bacteroidetes bacterium]|nr:hypothetical protein [Bacteroidota bacterium]